MTTLEQEIHHLAVVEHLAKLARLGPNNSLELRIGSALGPPDGSSRFPDERRVRKPCRDPVPDKIARTLSLALW
jgi:hypothetical protein